MSVVDTVGMERKNIPIISVLMPVVAISLLIDITSFAALYDLMTSPAPAYVLVSTVIKLLVLIAICRFFQIRELIFPALILLAAIALREYGHDLFNAFIALEKWKSMLSSTAFYLLSTCLVVLMWVVVGSHLCLNRKAADVLNGYAPVGTVLSRFKFHYPAGWSQPVVATS